MSQNPLLFYGLLEVLVIVLPLAGFWFWRLRQLRRQLNRAWETFEEIVEYHRYNLAHCGNDAFVNDASCYLDALEQLAEEEPPGTAESWQALWKELVRPATKPEDKTPPAELAQPSQELQDVEAVLDQQSRQIAELTAYKNHLVQLLRGKFEHIQHSNQELLSSVRHLMGGESDVRGLLEIIARLEENSENLQAMVGELEKAKMLVEPHLDALTRDNHRLRAETARKHAQIRDLTEEKQLCDAKIAELSKKIEQRTQMYNQIQRRYEDLQRDYLQLLK
ncbi:hypothetical protein [Methylogaea oryzae]|nr:hypothetical protein [Methylogaea oryzae]